MKSSRSDTVDAERVREGKEVFRELLHSLAYGRCTEAHSRAWI